MSEQQKTGWPPGMLQDDDKGLSRWLASRLDARQIVRQVALSIKQRICAHQFHGINIQPRDESGMVSWPCSKCGKVYQ